MYVILIMYVYPIKKDGSTYIITKGIWIGKRRGEKDGWNIPVGNGDPGWGCRFSLIYRRLVSGRAKCRCALRGNHRKTGPGGSRLSAARADGRGGTPDSLLEGEVIDLNAADEYDLRRLPGIGEKRARAIVEYREEHGPFQTIEELDKVQGIGEGILSGLTGYVTVESAEGKE